MTPPASFDAIAPYYQFLERITFGSLLHYCRSAHLEQLAQQRRALILGDGDGRFLESLLRKNSFAEVVSMDQSAAMLSLARQRVLAIPGARNRVQFCRGDARTVKLPDNQYDLVATNFFLDCFPAAEIALIVDRVLACCSNAVVWLDGDFRIPPGRWSSGIGRLALAGMYSAFAITAGLAVRRLSDPSSALVSRGFTLAAEKTWLRGFLSSRLWLRNGGDS